MGEQLKRFRVTYKGKNSRQYVTLLARDRAEAAALADASQTRRHERFPLTFSRIERDMKGKEMEAEVEKRSRDQERYETGELKIESVEEVK